MIEISGLWVNKSKSGESYMVGYLGGAKILIFKNKYKEDEKHPDYKLYVVQKEVEANDNKSDDIEF